MGVRIATVRGQRVILDADLATLYGVETKRFTEHGAIMAATILCSQRAIEVPAAIRATSSRWCSMCCANS